MVLNDNKISPANEHEKLQDYLMVNTPLKLAIAQSAIYELSPWYRLAFNLRDGLKEKYSPKKNIGKQKKDEKHKEFGNYKDNKQDEGTEGKDRQGMTDLEKEFVRAVTMLEDDLILSTTMSPGRQKVEKILIKVLENSGSISYHIAEKGGGITYPKSPMDRGEER